jgi:hypothetical protein
MPEGPHGQNAIIEMDALLGQVAPATNTIELPATLAEATPLNDVTKSGHADVNEKRLFVDPARYSDGFRDDGVTATTVGQTPQTNSTKTKNKNKPLIRGFFFSPTN